MKRPGLVVWCVATTPVALLSLLLLAQAITARGRLSAMCALLTAASVAFGLARRPRPALAAALLACVGAVALVLAAPSTRVTRAGTEVRTVYLFGGV